MKGCQDVGGERWMKEALSCHDHDMKVNERPFFMVQCSCGSTKNREILEFYRKF